MYNILFQYLAIPNGIAINIFAHILWYDAFHALGNYIEGKLVGSMPHLIQFFLY